MLIVNLLCAIFLICCHIAMAGLFEGIAYSKGYTKKSHPLLICLLFGIVGYIYILALPDLKLRQQNEKIIELLSNNK